MATDEQRMEIWERASHTMMVVQAAGEAATKSKLEIALASMLLATRMTKQHGPHMDKESFLSQVGMVWDSGLAEISDAEFKATLAALKN